MSILINIALVQNYDEDSRLKIAIIVTTFSGVATQLHLSVLCGERYAVVVESVAYGNIKRGRDEIKVTGRSAFPNLSRVSISPFC